MSDWKTQCNELLAIAHRTANANLLSHYKRAILGNTIRAASAIRSAESTRVHCNTSSMLQWTLNWTAEAQQLYWDNQQSTHRKTTQCRDSQRKRLWSVEHEHPISDCINALIDGCSIEHLHDWMYNKGSAVIVSQAELARLPQLGENRYEQANIRYTRFDPSNATRTR